MRKSPALRGAPSDAVVRRAWVEFTDSVQGPAVSDQSLQRAASRFLDFLGVEDLADPRAAARITPNAGKHLLAAFDGAQVPLSAQVKAALALEVVQRLREINLQDERWVSNMHTVTWLQLLLRRAVERLPSSGVGEVLECVVGMSLVRYPQGQDLFAEGVMPAATAVWQTVVEHPDCPPGVLRDACLNESLEVALAASAHPGCPEDAQIAVSLRV